MAGKRFRAVAAGAMTITLALGVVGCGDDDDTAATVDPDVCAAGQQLGGLFLQMPEDPSAFAAFATDTALPIVERLAAGVSGPTADDVAQLESVFTTMAETGDPSGLESPQYAEASRAVGELVHEECGAQQASITAVDYGFEGVPDELDAGLASFRFTNEGAEEHEMVVFRPAEGTTESLDELLALPPEESMAKVEMAGVTFAGPGESSYLAADLQPGTYFLVCFIPVGGGEEGEPHFMHGMKAELSVA
jgi:hypothetical protein